MAELIEATDPCTDCGTIFFREKKRGRPPTRCKICRENINEAQQAAVAQINPDTLYSGPVEKLQGDQKELPQGTEAQCPLCWRIFTSDSACESHKIYPQLKGLILCKDPATIGMVPRERRGLPIWTKPSDRVFS